MDYIEKIKSFFVEIPKNKIKSYKQSIIRLNRNRLRITAATAFISSFGFYLKIQRYPSIINDYYEIMFVSLSILTFFYFLLSYILEKTKNLFYINRVYVLSIATWISFLSLLDQLGSINGISTLYVVVILVMGIVFISPVFVAFSYFFSFLILFLGLPVVQSNPELIANELMAIVPLIIVAYTLQLFLYRNTRLLFINEEFKKEESEKLRLIIDTIPSYIFIVDTEGKIVLVNSSIAKVFSVEPDDLVGKYTVDYGMAEEKSKLYAKENMEVIRENKTIFKVEEIFVGDRSIGWFQIIKTPYRHSASIKPLILGIATNITELKETKEKLELEKEKAIKASKAKSDFLANMSHEIRTPLNGIIGFTDLILKSKLDNIQYKYTENIKKSTKNLLSIINDILDFSKIEAGKLELEFIKDDLKVLINEVYELMLEQAKEKKLSFKVNIDKDMPNYALIDPLRLKQILINLISNAIKFTMKGEISLSVSFYKINSLKGKFIFSVKDTGIGISEKQKENLFKAFSQGDPSITRKYGGSGLGLVIIKKLLEQMNSNISLESEENQGSNFMFSLETDYFYDYKKDNNKRNKLNFEVLNTDGKKIMIVDDVELNLELLTCIIKEYLPNSELTLAKDGMEALKLFKKEKFDLILMDVQMPNLDGISASIRMRQYEHNMGITKVPIVILSAGLIKDQEERVMEANISSFLSKPFKQREIYNILRCYLGENSEQYCDFNNKKEMLSYSLENKVADKKDEIHKELSLMEFCKEFYGLDIEEGLERSLNKEDLYLKLLESFNKKIEIVYKLLKRELKKENFDELQRLSHKICGIAGTVSAIKIYNKMRKFEELCSQEKKLEALKKIMLEVKKDIDDLKKALDIARTLFS